MYAVGKSRTLRPYKMRSHSRLFGASIAVIAAGAFVWTSGLARAQEPPDDPLDNGQEIDQIVEYVYTL